MADELETLSLAKLRPDPTNVRRTLGNIDALVASIKKSGVEQALLVRPAGDGTYYVVAGHRRLEACKRAKLADVPCIVRDMDGGQAVLEAMLTENLVRDDLHPLEEAAAFARLRDEFGLSQREMEPISGRSQTHISKRLSLLELPEEVQTAIAGPGDDGGITIAQALELVRLADMPERCFEVFMRWQRQPNIALRHVVDEELQAASDETNHAEVLAGLAATGVKVIEVDYHRWHGVAYRRLGKNRDQVPMTARSHRKLACHAAVVDAAGVAHEVCITPTTHPEYQSSSGGRDVSDEEKAERARARERTKQLADAHAARASFLKGLVAMAEPEGPVSALMAAQWLTWTINEVYEDDVPAVAAELLGVEGSRRPVGGYVDFAAPLQMYAAGGPDALARLGLALSFAVAEKGLRGDHWNGGVVAAHFAYLASQGYKPSAVEKASLKPARDAGRGRRR